MTRPARPLRDRELLEMLAPDPGLLAIADALVATDSRRRHSSFASAPHRHRRHMLLLAAAVAVAIAVVAPAFGVGQALIGFFTTAPAPHDTVLSFDGLDVEAPAGMQPNVVAADARRVARYTLSDGTPVNLDVAPTKSGGFCELLSGFEEGCDARREIPIALGFAAQTLPAGPAVIYGSVLGTEATAVTVTLSSGQTLDLPLTRVSAPITAGFFFAQVDPSTRPVAAVSRDAAGNVLATFQLHGAAPGPELPPGAQTTTG